MRQDLMSIKKASIWASGYLGKEVTTSNISYLIQYGRIKKQGRNGASIIDRFDLEQYYQQNNQQLQAKKWADKMGDNVNWELSFSEYKEAQTTKHVHRLHPYKGKFIPQLVEYFMDSHTDKFKQQCFFNKGDIVLDPFCGSGTTLVQANELGIHALGIDVSTFNTFIANIKIDKHNVDLINKTAQVITQKLNVFQQQNNNLAFEQALLSELKDFNNEFFPTPEYKHKLKQNTIDEKNYGTQKSCEFNNIYQKLIKEYGIKLKQNKNDSFIDKWFLKVVRDEIDFVFNEIKAVKNKPVKQVLALILSRTIRSCRATTHADLGTLKQPISRTYYCKKHGKICKPLFTISNWWQRYTQDTLKRIEIFDSLKSNTLQKCIVGDSRNVDIINTLKRKSEQFSNLIKEHKIDGIFSSPPYVGLIDYHQQHAYAYDLFGFDRKDELEIGPLSNGQGVAARKSYTQGVADVLNNSKQYFKEDYNVFLVANDKYGLYPKIAQMANMKIINQYKRPVLNRVEKSRGAYSETIFHLKER